LCGDLILVGDRRSRQGRQRYGDFGGVAGISEFGQNVNGAGRDVLRRTQDKPAVRGRRCGAGPIWRVRVDFRRVTAGILRGFGFRSGLRLRMRLINETCDCYLPWLI